MAKVLSLLLGRETSSLWVCVTTRTRRQMSSSSKEPIYLVSPMCYLHVRDVM